MCVYVLFLQLIICIMLFGNASDHVVLLILINLIWFDLISSIGKPVAKLWPFLYIQDGRQPPSWISEIRKLHH